MLGSRKTLAGFVLFEALGLMIGVLIADHFNQPGGGFNSGPFIGSMVGAALLWWSAVLFTSAVLDSRP